ncbi:MAG: beta-lactamase family protein [Pseudomonadota bacterium]|nr:beta-lactamase family protein [Pseudomonadota bacterium]
MNIRCTPILPRRLIRSLVSAAALAAALFTTAIAGPVFATAPGSPGLDAEVGRAMEATGAKGLAIAIIDDGKVTHVRSHGLRNAAGDPLEPDTIMYGASITKAAFAYMVMQLVDEGRLELDRPLGEYLGRPLTDYPDEDKYASWPDLEGDDRWRRITARHVLTHSTGFPNFGFLAPDGKLRMHFDPGSRYGYSGDGFILLQFVIERGLGLDLREEMQRRVFDRFGMINTDMKWRPEFAGNLADGWRIDGRVEPHDERSTVRAAGSMDTTIADIADIARLAAGFVRGDGLSAESHAEMTSPQLPITTASQFPTLQPELPVNERRADLAAGLGMVVFDGPQGPGFNRGGHNEWTGNTLVCVQEGRRCVVILSNDVRAEAAFPHLVEFVLGETGAPWQWIYPGMRFWRPES